MKKLLCMAVLGVTALSAETVWLSAKGKTFHRVATCMSLSRAKGKLTADRKEAEAHGLKACGICFRAKAAKKADNAAWAKGGAK